MPGATRAGVRKINVMSNADAGRQADRQASGPDRQALAYRPLVHAAARHGDAALRRRGAERRRRHAVRQRDDGLRALPDETRNRIDKLNAIHWVEHSRRDGGVALATE